MPVTSDVSDGSFTKCLPQGDSKLQGTEQPERNRTCVVSLPVVRSRSLLVGDGKTNG